MSSYCSCVGACEAEIVALHCEFIRRCNKRLYNCRKGAHICVGENGLTESWVCSEIPAC